MDQDIIDYRLLQLDELQDEYQKLSERFKELYEMSENDAQCIHELRRSLDAAHAVEKYLTQELETLSQNNTESLISRIQTELEELKRNHSKLKQDHLALQEDQECMAEENMELREKLKVATTQQKPIVEKTNTNELLNEQIERLNVMQEENSELLHKLEEYYENEVRLTMTAAEREKNIAILKDQVQCLQENLHCRHIELEEKTQSLECAQEQLADANTRIAMLMSNPEENGRKGNSLFAEVDDQRQAMKQLLASQKKSYMEMKKVYNESQYEIRRLKRENIAMHTELETCSSIFCNADRTYQDKLNNRLRQLHKQNEQLERKLIWTQDRLKDLGDAKGVLWIDSMFDFCKQETNDLKQQLHSVRIQKASLEEQLRNAQQNMARWRFESLKSRCILLDRESLLNDHQIPFKAVNVLEFDISDQQLQTARPRIVSTTTTTADMVKTNDFIDLEVKSELLTPSNIKPQSPTISLQSEVDDENKENLIQNKVKQEHQSETPPPRQATHVTKEPPFLTKKVELPPADILPGPSILCTQRSVFAREPKSHVKFSTQEATIHNISSDRSIILDDDKQPEEIKCLAAATKAATVTGQKVRGIKSNIMVRRFVFGTRTNSNNAP